MKLLVVHDRREIANELKDIIARECAESCKFDVAYDLLGARDFLRANIYDLVILDLTLPVSEGQVDTPLSNVAILLDEVFAGADIHAPADILGISRDPDILDTVKSRIGDHVLACIHEDAAGKWKDVVVAKLGYIGRVTEARQIAISARHDVDVLIVTALDKEAAPFRTMFELHPVPHMRGALSFGFQCSEGRMRRGILFSVGASGQAATGSATQSMLMFFRPKLALMTGFCGGVAGKVSYGDLLVFTTSYAWDYGKWEEIDKGAGPETVFRARPTPRNIPARGIRETVRTLLNGDYVPTHAAVGEAAGLSGGRVPSWTTRQTAAASGSAVVTSGQIVDEIRDLDDGIWAIDMESYAFYLACETTPVVQPDYVCFKSVADYCNGTKEDSLHPACCFISASFAKLLITSKYRFC